MSFEVCQVVNAQKLIRAGEGLLAFDNNQNVTNERNCFNNVLEYEVIWGI